MSDTSQGPGWWQASDGRWYAPEWHPDYRYPPAEPPSDRRLSLAVGWLIGIGVAFLAVTFMIVLIGAPEDSDSSGSLTAEQQQLAAGIRQEYPTSMSDAELVSAADEVCRLWARPAPIEGSLDRLIDAVVVSFTADGLAPKYLEASSIAGAINRVDYCLEG